MNATTVSDNNQIPGRRQFAQTALALLIAPAALAAPAQRTLFWRGSNLGLGEPTRNCHILVEEDGVVSEWTVAQIVGRLGEFSEAAKTRIAAEFGMQLLQF